MKIVSNTVDFDTYIWDDPGDYPNAVAGSRLPSCGVCEFDGEIVLEAENDEDRQEFNTISDWFNDWLDCECATCKPYGWDITWGFERNGDRITAFPQNAEERTDDHD